MSGQRAGVGSAARDEAIARYVRDCNLPYMEGERLQGASKVEAFTAGAIWAADRLPSRDEVAAVVMGRHFVEHGPGYGEHLEITDAAGRFLADAVRDLIRGRIEGEA